MTFRPTVNSDREPTTCFCCGRRAICSGIGSFKSDPRYLCMECLMISDAILDAVKNTRRFEGFESVAIDMAGERAGAYLDQLGKTDLATLDPDEWHTFLKVVVLGFGDSLRKVIKDGVPF